MGHDVTGDISLLINECIRCGVPLQDLRPLRRLMCKKQMGVGRLRIPLPLHVSFDYPCELILCEMNSAVVQSDATPFKWTSLEECVAAFDMSMDDTVYPPHDAGGDGTKRLQFFRIGLVWIRCKQVIRCLRPCESEVFERNDHSLPDTIVTRSSDGVVIFARSKHALHICIDVYRNAWMNLHVYSWTANQTRSLTTLSV